MMMTIAGDNDNDNADDDNVVLMCFIYWHTGEKLSGAQSAAYHCDTFAYYHQEEDDDGGDFSYNDYDDYDDHDYYHYDDDYDDHDDADDDYDDNFQL